MSRPKAAVHRAKLIFLMMLLAAGLPACTEAAAVQPTGTAASEHPIATIPAMITNSPPAPATATPQSTRSTPAPAPTAGPMVCAPFPGYTQTELLDAISNPFNPPPAGSDDPHQAVDLAIVREGIALGGGPVQALLPGKVAMIVNDRFPYGNAILIESPLSALPPEFLAPEPLPTLAPTLPPHPVLTCPSITPPAYGPEPERGFYLLYAHLEAQVEYQPGDQIGCGDLIGAVGQSGNALNPHLHLEARLGPAGARFNGMAHYEARALPEEMGNYCLWRVSNLFQVVDPTRLLRGLP